MLTLLSLILYIENILIRWIGKFLDDFSWFFFSFSIIRNTQQTDLIFKVHK